MVSVSNAVNRKKFIKNSSLITFTFNVLIISRLQCDELNLQLITANKNPVQANIRKGILRINRP